MYVIGCKSSSQQDLGATSGCVYLFNDLVNGEWGYPSTPSLYTPSVYGRYRSWLPYGVSATQDPASTAGYAGRLYMCGGHSYNLVLDEHHRLWKQGMRAPEAPPEITGATGTGAIAYLSWYDELTGERSSLSAGTVISTALPRTWALPARPPDDTVTADGDIMSVGGAEIQGESDAARTFFLRPGDRYRYKNAGGVSYNLVAEVAPGMVRPDLSGELETGGGIEVLPYSRATHLELWISAAGGLPQLVTRVRMGTTSFVESTASEDLGESFIGAFERFPRCTMNVIWNDRQLMAGDPDNPDRVYMSELFYPERYTGLNFRTKDGAPVTGMLALRDYCLIFSRDRTYMLQGYTESDFSFTMVEQSLGSIGHNSNVVVHGNAYVWTEKGPFLYNGSWHPLAPDNAFSVPTTEDSPLVRGSTDPEENLYIVMGPGLNLIDNYYPLTTATTFVHSPAMVMDYTTVQPEAGGTFATARLSIDYQDTLLTSGAGVARDTLYYYLSNKWGRGRMYSLSQDTAYLETGMPNNTGTPDNSFKVFVHAQMKDYDPTWGGEHTNALLTAPEFMVTIGHNFFSEPGGNMMEGKTFRKLWVDARTYSDATLLRLYPGDDDALEMGLRWGTQGTYQQFTVPKHLLGIDVMPADRDRSQRVGLALPGGRDTSDLLGEDGPDDRAGAVAGVHRAGPRKVGLLQGIRWGVHRRARRAESAGPRTRRADEVLSTGSV